VRVQARPTASGAVKGGGEEEEKKKSGTFVKSKDPYPAKGKKTYVTYMMPCVIVIPPNMLRITKIITTTTLTIANSITIIIPSEFPPASSSWRERKGVGRKLDVGGPVVVHQQIILSSGIHW
jgi:hypothetical protein